MCNTCMDENSLHHLMPGDRVMVFDPRLYVDDFKTPLSVTVKPATVVARYGKKVNNNLTNNKDCFYPDLVDVKFDHRPDDISEGHFTHAIKRIDNG